jgi:hypothetical protein
VRRRPEEALPVAAVPPGISATACGRNCLRLLEKLKDSAQRTWYVRQATAIGWSRSMLEHWIDSGLYSRQGNAVTNFKQVLPPQSDLANEIVRDPYNFDFLTLRTQAAERELESGPCRTFPAPLRHGPLRFIASPCHIEGLACARC